MKKTALLLLILGVVKTTCPAYINISAYQASLVQLVKMAEQTSELLEAIAPTIETLENLPDTFSEIEVNIETEAEKAQVQKPKRCGYCGSTSCPFERERHREGVCTCY